jgi:hypothetical protein
MGGLRRAAAGEGGAPSGSAGHGVECELQASVERLKSTARAQLEEDEVGWGVKGCWCSERLPQSLSGLLNP